MGVRGTTDALCLCAAPAPHTQNTARLRVGCPAPVSAILLFLNGDKQSFCKSGLDPVLFSFKKFIFLSNLNLFWVCFCFLRVFVVDVIQYLCLSPTQMCLNHWGSAVALRSSCWSCGNIPTLSFEALQLRCVFWVYFKKRSGTPDTYSVLWI